MEHGLPYGTSRGIDGVNITRIGCGADSINTHVERILISFFRGNNRNYLSPNTYIVQESDENDSKKATNIFENFKDSKFSDNMS